MSQTKLSIGLVRWKVIILLINKIKTIQGVTGVLMDGERFEEGFWCKPKTRKNQRLRIINKAAPKYVYIKIAIIPTKNFNIEVH